MVMFLDADDLLAPSAIEASVAALRNEPDHGWKMIRAMAKSKAARQRGV
jgi:hypothetical protein